MYKELNVKILIHQVVHLNCFKLGLILNLTRFIIQKFKKYKKIIVIFLIKFK